MTKEEAFRILDQAVCQLRATREEHNVIITALKTLQPEIEKKDLPQG